MLLTDNGDEDKFYLLFKLFEGSVFSESLNKHSNSEDSFFNLQEHLLPKQCKYLFRQEVPFSGTSSYLSLHCSLCTFFVHLPEDYLSII